MNTSSFYNSVITGLIANTIYTLILLYIIQNLRYYYNLRRHFHNKTFETFRKDFPNDIVQTVKTRVQKNIISFNGVKVGKEDAFLGELIINPINLKYGEGFHMHSMSDGFAFIKIIIKDKNTILIEAPYTSIKEEETKKTVSVRVYQAFIWKKKK